MRQPSPLVPFPQNNTPASINRLHGFLSVSLFHLGTCIVYHTTPKNSLCTNPSSLFSSVTTSFRLCSF